MSHPEAHVGARDMRHVCQYSQRRHTHSKKNPQKPKETLHCYRQWWLGRCQNWPDAPFYKQMFLSFAKKKFQNDEGFFFSIWYSVGVSHVTVSARVCLMFESFLAAGMDKGHWPLPSAARCDGDVIGLERQTKLIKEEGVGTAVWGRRWKVLQDTWGLLVKWAATRELKDPVCEV